MSYVEIKVTGDDKRDKSAFDIGFREFKKRMKRSGILDELRDRGFYRSPSAKRKWKQNEAIKRRKRDERKEQRVKHNENW